MANGRPPSCNSCKHFRLRLLSGEVSANVIRQVPGRCVCVLHGVQLPFHLTREILICADWVDERTDETMAQWSEAARKRYRRGVLYCYPNEYEPTTNEFAMLSDLPASM
jgi:hypothetical protein